MATVITTAAGLQNMDLDLTDDYELGNDIDVSGIANFEPVGGWNGLDPFTGSFDGKGFKISNLTVNRAADDYIGLFGETDGATFIKNVTLEDFTLTGDDNIGALIGYNVDTPFSNITVTGLTINGDDNVGGIIGTNYAATANTGTNCTSAGTITCATGSSVGGLIGVNYLYALSLCNSSVIVNGIARIGGLIGHLYSGTLLKVHATGKVDGAGLYVGGCIGYFQGALGAADTANRCFGSGATTNTGDVTGGFVGEHAGGIINDSYALGAVEGDDYVGGFAGENEDLNRCYSTGAITHGIGATRVGGFTGLNREVMSACFWDTTTSGEATGAGGGTPQTGVTGHVTATMKMMSTFLEADWSIPSIWNVSPGCVSGYPCLVGVNPCCGTSALPPLDPTVAPKRVSLELIRNAEMMNLGRAYVDKSGNFTYESRFYR